jgi:Holliday junction resolvase RusA-like endonuclease
MSTLWSFLMSRSRASAAQDETRDDQIERLEFFVEGTPIPQGSKKAFVIRGRAVIVDDNAPKLHPWRLKVKQAAMVALAGRDGFPAQQPVAVFLDFYMPRKVSVKRPRPSVRPDLDKLIRAVLDALTDARVYADDGQVVAMDPKKWYAEDKPGVRIVVRELA